MDSYYSDERNVQILISLMKAHGVRKVIASPGTTNISLVASLQQDDYFEMYSSVDERSAAYIACGLAAESGEPVALSCTGATASRNYISGLTEAYYRKLPILAITSTHHLGHIGLNIPQVIDRTALPNDIAKLSVQIPTINSKEDEWAYTVMMNKALLELNHRGGGPVHINLATKYSRNFSVKELPPVNVINRIMPRDEFPVLTGKKVAIFIGAHKPWSDEFTDAVDSFCEKYNGVVLCEHAANYTGKYGVNGSIVASQIEYDAVCRQMDVLIHLGDIAGTSLKIKPKQVWRVNPDGEIRDIYKKLRYVFEMEEETFFEKYVSKSDSVDVNTTYYNEWKQETDELRNKISDLPFSNVWIAHKTLSKLPEGSSLHLGILNSLRTWNYFEKSNNISSYSNTGGFGIDGGVSSLIGASLVNRDKLYFGVVGDLAFFYDMNSIGNRHVGNNIRLMVVNNSRGTEFRNYWHPGAMFGEDADKFISAGGHYGNQSPELVKNYAENLGFEYLTAKTKEEYLANVDYFVSEQKYDRPVIFEVFTDSKMESDALYELHHLEMSAKGNLKNKVKKIIGEKRLRALKKLLKKS